MRFHLSLLATAATLALSVAAASVSHVGNNGSSSHIG